METFRGWFYNQNQNILFSQTKDFKWYSSNEIAHCSHGCEITICLEQGHICMCGFYSKKDLDDLLNGYNNFDIYGIIYNHGVVVEGTLGVRAEKAMIIALYVSDLELQTKLKDRYPDVKFLIPPVRIQNIYNKKVLEANKKPNTWQTQQNRHQIRRDAYTRKIELLQKLYPGGEDAENAYVKKRLVNASKEEIISFVIAYAKDSRWADRRWLSKIENSSKAKPGDIVFAANNTNKPFVYLGSTRPFGGQSSIRYVIDPYGEVKKIQNIRRWDEEQSFKTTREKAIKEWGGLGAISNS